MSTLPSSVKSPSGFITSSLAPGIPALSCDDKIVTAIMAHHFESPGHTMKIVIRNTNGAIYRTIMTRGMSALMHMISALEDLSLVDMRLDQIFSPDGIDAEFCPPKH